MEEFFPDWIDNCHVPCGWDIIGFFINSTSILLFIKTSSCHASFWKSTILKHRVEKDRRILYTDCHRIRRVSERFGNLSQQKRDLQFHCIDMNELTIKRILESDVRTKDSFRGVYSRNELPIAAPTTLLYVCNMDPN